MLDLDAGNNTLSATVWLLAHDSQISSLATLIHEHTNILQRYRLAAYAAVAHRLHRPTHPHIHAVELDQLRAEVASGNVLAVIFLIDPSLQTPAEPDVAELSRLCSKHNVPFASNLATAYPVLNSFMQTRVAHLIFNPVAGQRDSTQDLLQIRQILSPWMHLHIHFTSREVDADQLAQQAVAAQPDLIIASGGDGTVSLVAGQMLSTGIPLGVIPRGTANALSVAMGIPTTVMGACQLILAGTTRRLDAAYCNHHLMTLLAGIGLEAGTVGKATRELKNQWGVLAYLIAGWEQLGEQTLFNAEIEIEGQVHQFPAFAVTIANAAPPTSVLAQGVGEVIFDDGLLDITIITKQDAQQPTIKSKLQAARDLINLYGSALVNTKVDLPNLYHFRTDRLTLKTVSPEPIVVDGEMVGNTPLEVSCLPSALTVVAPAKRRPTSVEKVAGFWVQRVFPSVSTLIAALGLGGLIGLPIAFWLMRLMTNVWIPAQTEALEMNILQFIQQFTTPFWNQVMLVITRFGNPEIALPIFLIILGLLWWQRDYWKLLMGIVAFMGTRIINYQLGLLLEHARPAIQPPLLTDEALALSFHGNYLQGTVLYGLIAYLLALRFPKLARWFYGSAILWVGAIGFSRLYLGIQWPLDVLAGIVSGFLWLMICIVLLRLQDIRQAAKRQKQQMVAES
jgi:YegS/Rv2252/BmrU family lipid kinase